MIIVLDMYFVLVVLDDINVPTAYFGWAKVWFLLNNTYFYTELYMPYNILIKY